MAGSGLVTGFPPIRDWHICIRSNLVMVGGGVVGERVAYAPKYLIQSCRKLNDEKIICTIKDESCKVFTGFSQDSVANILAGADFVRLIRHRSREGVYVRNHR